MARNTAGTSGCIPFGTALVLCVAVAIFLAAAPPSYLQRPLQDARAAAGRPLLATAPHDAASTSSNSSSRSFTISNDRFMKNGVPFRLISGSVHYNRIPPDLWADRLARAKALGLNAVQFYVPWNFHQPQPGPEGVLPFEGWRDVARFISTAGDMGLLVLLRPGPYICGEWEFGGLPAWLLQQDTAMPVRSADPAFLAAVDAWWGQLLPQLAPLTYDRGGPIIMVQVENEYGYYGGSKPYLRHLADTIRHHMGQQVLLYTVDGASLLPAAMGSLPGGDVLTTVDFGPTTDVEAAFSLQRRFNAPGRSPPFCVEYYTGWLTHWGEAMAHSEAAAVAATLADILAAANSSASVNLYMAAGGTNFGPWAGANVFPKLAGGQQRAGPAEWRLRQAALQQQQQDAGNADSSSSRNSSSSSSHELYQPHITSYDYNCPIGEAGTVGQLGMGGASKFDALRGVIAAAQGIDVQQLPSLPPPVPLVAYEPVVFSEGLYLLDALPQLSASCRGSTYCSSELGQGAGASSSEDATAKQQQHSHEREKQQPSHYRPAGQDEQQAGAAQVQSWRLLLQQLTTLASQPSVAARPVEPQLQDMPQWQPHPLEVQEGTAMSLSSVADNAQPDGSVAGSVSAPAAAGPVTSSSQYPLPMEQYGQYYGLILYQTVLAGDQAAAAGGRLHLTAHDTVWAFLDGQLLGRSYRSSPRSIDVPPSPFSGSKAAAGSSSAQQRKGAAAGSGLAAGKRVQSEGSGSSSEGRLLQLLVWPLGRNNFGLFGSSMNDQKGLLGNVSLAGCVLQGWTVHHLCLEGGGPDAFSALQLPWRPLAPAGAAANAGGAGLHWHSKKAWQNGRLAADVHHDVAAHAGDLTGGNAVGQQHSMLQQSDARPVLILPGSSVWSAETGGSVKQQQQQQQLGDVAGSSSAGGILTAASNITAFIATVAEAQAQAVIAAAADAATGNGPATAIARASATIRAGRAAAAAANASLNAAQHAKGPLLLRGVLHVPGNASTRISANQQTSLLPAGRPADTFLHLGEGWGRGQVWVHGHSLGSYWAEQGPQMSLYLPGSFLQPGPNEVLLLELDGALPARQGSPLTIACADAPDFDGPAAGPAPLG